MNNITQCDIVIPTGSEPASSVVGLWIAAPNTMFHYDYRSPTQETEAINSFAAVNMEHKYWFNLCWCQYCLLGMANQEAIQMGYRPRWG